MASLWFIIACTLPAMLYSVTTKTFSKMAKTTDRPKWDGRVVNDVVITYDLSVDPAKYKLTGTVIPLSVGGKKPDTPQIFNNAQKNGVYDGGHVLAIFLAGPNRKENIVAQPGRWQQYGSWNKLEQKIEEYVMGKMGWADPKTVADIKKHNPGSRSRSYDGASSGTKRVCREADKIPVPPTLVDIEIEITEWQSDKDSADNDKLIPKKYKGKLTCRGASTETVTFEIQQPQVQAQPISSMHGFA